MRVTNTAGPIHLELAPCTRSMAYLVIKRWLDILVSILVLLISSPLLLLTLLAIKVSSPGPLLYKWRVVGLGGQRFTGYKLRTMVVDADKRKKDIWHYNERNGPTFKMKGDPRVTPVGSVLRKFSLDETPQLWSILKGDMSLVGPRPVGVDEWEHFQPWQRRKLSVVPGGISLWHIRGKPPAFNDWVRLDLEYIDNWSLWLDIKILVGGMWCILSGKNY